MMRNGVAADASEKNECKWNNVMLYEISHVLPSGYQNCKLLYVMTDEP